MGSVEGVVWDQHLVGKEYLGEVAVGVGEWFCVGVAQGGRVEEGVWPFTIPLVSTRTSTPSQGTITLKIGFVRAPAPSSASSTSAEGADTGIGAGGEANQMSFEEIYDVLVRRSRVLLPTVEFVVGIACEGCIAQHHPLMPAPLHDPNHAPLPGRMGRKIVDIAKALGGEDAWGPTCLSAQRQASVGVGASLTRHLWKRDSIGALPSPFNVPLLYHYSRPILINPPAQRQHSPPPSILRSSAHRIHFDNAFRR
ncbi:hypothetical protein JR316_0007597 [Psilocybe cubensis]|uniref:Uncharacterized protein n=1 Tax=Psilocybe cubensis TaxID=181762 RepID=A0ACB8GU18_PSICU|nr:hypothetical protein JR316_0007597 [Psilocybe cubensis]KAH9479023.1 hypothetical protein JR316_0007597 [Psilocybe cubensis]